MTFNSYMFTCKLLLLSWPHIMYYIIYSTSSFKYPTNIKWNKRTNSPVVFVSLEAPYHSFPISHLVSQSPPLLIAHALGSGASLWLPSLISQQLWMEESHPWNSCWTSPFLLNIMITKSWAVMRSCPARWKILSLFCLLEQAVWFF